MESSGEVLRTLSTIGDKRSIQSDSLVLTSQILKHFISNKRIRDLESGNVTLSSRETRERCLRNLRKTTMRRRKWDKQRKLRSLIESNKIWLPIEMRRKKENWIWSKKERREPNRRTTMLREDSLTLSRRRKFSIWGTLTILRIWISLRARDLRRTAVWLRNIWHWA